MTEDRRQTAPRHSREGGNPVRPPPRTLGKPWIPAFAGMTEGTSSRTLGKPWIPAFAGMTEGTLSRTARRTWIPPLAGMTERRR
jgi:hypothetical protein